MTVELITPDGPVFKGEAHAVQVPGTQGSFQILRNHAPIISTLEKGRLKIDTATESKVYVIEGGVVEVLNNQVVVLAQRVLS
ncbi:MAG: ATP synthase F1 subunit epsilon [Bacteroidetes bacterium]|jgi:F-type H+-transporting ATPase subunit epsilon|nr:ATP synthase F1 subunit epsilon [Bacteroidota bacterium]